MYAVTCTVYFINPCNIRMCHRASSILYTLQYQWHKFHDMVHFIWVLYKPVRTHLQAGSATSNGVFPSVFLMLGSAPCWSSTNKRNHATRVSFANPSNVFNITTAVYSSPHYQCKHPFSPLQQLRAVAWNSNCLEHFHPPHASATVSQLQHGQKSKHCVMELNHL